MDAAKVAQLKLFVKQVEANPAVLQDPSLHFFRDFLERLGAKLPASAYGKAEKTEKAKSADVEGSDDDMPELEEQFDTAKHFPSKGWEDEASEEEPESEVELDDSGVVPPDDDPPQKMGDPSIEVTDEARDNAQIAKGKAMEALAEGNLEEAVKQLTEAVIANPTSALLYANRAGIFVKMKKPNAAIRDSDAALKINPDSAKAYKWRGEAKALLGQWEEAAKDLHVASRLDYDEEIAAVLRKVEPNVHALEEHRRKYERLRKNKEETRAAEIRNRRRAQAQAAYNASKKEKNAGSGGFPFGGAPNTAGGFGGMPSTPGGVDMSKLLKDPELMAAFQDQEVMAALQDVMANPANITKYQQNPKIATTIAKVMKLTGYGGP